MSALVTADATATPPPGHGRLVVWLSLAQLISWGTLFYSFALVMEPVEAELGLSRAEASLAFSGALLVEGLLAWPVGRLIDRGHERAVMTGGSLLAALALALHALVSSRAGFYAVWLLVGAAMAATLYTPVFAVVTRRYPASFRRAIITLTFLGGLASTVFIPLTAWLVQALGWRAAMGVLGGLNLVLCLPIHARWLRGAPGPRAAAATGSDAPAPESLRAHLRSAPFLLIAVFSVLMMGIAAAIPPHLVSLLREGGLPEGVALAVPASVGLLQVAGRVLLFVTERRLDVHAANRWIPALLPLGLTALLLGQGAPIGLLAFVVLYGLGNGMLTIVKGTAVAQYVSHAHVAALNGALGLPQALARAATPWMLGVLWSPARGYAVGLTVLLMAGVLAVMALWWAQRVACSNQPGERS